MFTEIRSSGIIINVKEVEYVDGHIVVMRSGLEINLATGDADVLRADLQSFNRIQAAAAVPQKPRPSGSYAVEVPGV